MTAGKMTVGGGRAKGLTGYRSHLEYLGIGLEEEMQGAPFEPGFSETAGQPGCRLGEGPFPTLETDLRNARFHISYLAGDHWGWKLFAEHETYESEDWYVDGLGPDGILNILTMGPLSPDYDVTVVRLMATYRF